MDVAKRPDRRAALGAAVSAVVAALVAGVRPDLLASVQFTTTLPWASLILGAAMVTADSDYGVVAVVLFSVAAVAAVVSGVVGSVVLLPLAAASFTAATVLGFVGLPHE